MENVENFDETSVQFLLFNSDSGACSRLNKIEELSTENLNVEMNLLEKIILNKKIKTDPTFLNIAEKFIDWGCDFIVNIILKSIHLNCVLRVLSMIEYIHDLLPINSKFWQKSFLKKETIIAVLNKIKNSFFGDVPTYVGIFSKLWILLEQDVKDIEVFNTGLVCLYEFVRSLECVSLVTTIFDDAERVLSLHLKATKSKISDRSVINNLLGIVKVRVRDKIHAIPRLHFWWNLICAIHKDTCAVLFSHCVIPYLANLFGRYITLDTEEKFPYSLSSFNCLNNCQELTQLCNHSMAQLLRIVSDVTIPNMEKSPKFGTIQHWANISPSFFTAENVELLLISFYFWCLSVQQSKSKTVMSPFNLLITVFKCFTKRFLVYCQVKQQNLCHDEKNGENQTPLLYLVVDKIMDFKNHLNKELKDNQYTETMAFTNSLKVTKSIIDSLHTLGDNTSIIPIGLQLLLRVFYDHLHTMNRLILSKENCSAKNQYVTWLECSKKIIDLTFPRNSLAFSLIMSQDVDMINKNWFADLLSLMESVASIDERHEFDRTSILTNLQCWYYLSTKLTHRLDKDSFTIFSDPVEVNLTPFMEYLAIPLSFVGLLPEKSMTKERYDEIWKIWEHIYIDLITKAQLLPNFSDTAWSQSILLILTKIYKITVGCQGNKSITNVMAFNMILRAMRLVVLRSEDGEIHSVPTVSDNSHQPLWSLFKMICENFPVFSLATLKVAFKELGTSGGDENGNREENLILDSNPVTPNSKWSKLKTMNLSHFNCDLNSNFDTFLSLIKSIIHKIGRRKSTMLEIADLLSPNLNHLKIVLNRQSRVDIFSRVVRPRINYDPDVAQLEGFVVLFLNRIKIYCYKNGMTNGILNSISPFLVFIFASESGMFSRSTVQSCIYFWNETIDSISDAIEYPEDLIKAIKMIKLTHKKVTVPESMGKKFQEAEIDYNLLPRDNMSTDEESKIETIKTDTDQSISSVLPQISNIESDNLPPSQLTVVETDHPNPIDLEKPSTSENKSIKEFSSPNVNFLKPSQRKRSFFDLSRKSSDADYAIIEPVAKKPCRLTRHQKEKMLQNLDEYRPIMYNDLDVVPKLSLLTQDSETTVSVSSDDVFMRRIDSVDVDRISSDTESLRESITNVPAPDLDNEEQTVVLSSDSEEEIQVHEVASTVLENQACPAGTRSAKKRKVQPTQETSPLTELIVEPVTQPEPEQETQTPANPEPEPEVEPELKQESQINETQQIDIEIRNSPSKESKIEAQAPTQAPVLTVMETKPMSELVPSILKNIDSIPGKLSAPLYNSPIQSVKQSMNLYNRSPIASRTSQRTHLLVQMALEKQKNNRIKSALENTPISSLPNSAERPKPPSIIRHFWSERKKDKRVSFVIPSDCDMDKENIEEIETDPVGIEKICEEELPEKEAEFIPESEGMKACGSFLSPIADRSQSSLANLPQQLCLDIDSIITEDSKILSSRQDLESIISNFSPILNSPESLQERIQRQMKDALEIATDDERREILKCMLSLVSEYM